VDANYRQNGPFRVKPAKFWGGATIPEEERKWQTSEGIGEGGASTKGEKRGQPAEPWEGIAKKRPAIITLVEKNA